MSRNKKKKKKNRNLYHNYYNSSVSVTFDQIQHLAVQVFGSRFYQHNEPNDDIINT